MTAERERLLIYLRTYSQTKRPHSNSRIDNFRNVSLPWAFSLGVKRDGRETQLCRELFGDVSKEPASQTKISGFPSFSYSTSLYR